MRAFRAQRIDEDGEQPYVPWLPALVAVLSRDMLERLLAGGIIDGLAGQPMGIDEVAP